MPPHNSGKAGQPSSAVARSAANGGTTKKGHNARHSRKQSVPPREQTLRFNNEEVAAARLLITNAFTLAGLVSNDGINLCPEGCGEQQDRCRIYPESESSDTSDVKPWKTGWRCMKCGNGGNALDALKARGVPFALAVGLLLGQIDPNKIRINKRNSSPDMPEPRLHLPFRAVLDHEVYDEIRKRCDVSKAQEFFARWHISPQAVQQSGFTAISDTRELKAHLVKKFGVQRLVACGVAIDSESGAFCLFESYPIVEPHIRPDGVWVGMQFRADEAQEAKAKAYPKLKAEYDAAKAQFETSGGEGVAPKRPKFVSKILSLRGGAPGQHLLGQGLPAVASIPDSGKRRHKVFIVEGGKDMLAMRSLANGRFYAYAIPGVGNGPTEQAIKLFREKDVKPFISTDGDAAGWEAAEKLSKLFETENFAGSRVCMPPEGMDITDVLVDAHERIVTGTEFEAQAATLNRIALKAHWSPVIFAASETGPQRSLAMKPDGTVRVTVCVNRPLIEVLEDMIAGLTKANEQAAKASHGDDAIDALWLTALGFSGKRPAAMSEE